MSSHAFLRGLAAAVLCIGACSDGTDDPDTSDSAVDTGDSTDTSDANCEYARDSDGEIVSCQGATPQDPEIACPDGFQCSGLSAFWCYRGDGCELPICLPEDAQIDTPSGPVRVTDLRVGQLVWTMTAHGDRVAAPILQLGSAVAPADHQMLRLTLSDGRSTRASPRHPGLDGELIATFASGQRYGNSAIVEVGLEPYDGVRTFDLLPAGDTGVYWVDGILMGSTLRQRQSAPDRAESDSPR